MVELIIKKAKQSICRFQVAAIGFDRRGKVLGVTNNRPRIVKKGGGIHAEMDLIHRYRGLSKIVICRIGKGGNLLPIHPCPACLRVATKLGIQIESVKIGKQNT